MRAFLRIEAVVTTLAMRLAIAFLVAAVVLALYQVTMRFVFSASSTWSEVLTRLTMIWSVFLGAAATYRNGSMIAVTVVANALPERVARALFMLAHTLTLVFLVLLMWQGTLMTLRVMGQTLSSLNMSIAWAYAAIPVGAAFIAVAVLGCLVRGWHGEWRVDMEGDEAAQ